jgi:hypothetical protein
MDAGRPDREVNSFALLQLAASVAGSQRRSSAEDNEKLLRRVMEMKRRPVSGA